MSKDEQNMISLKEARQATQAMIRRVALLHMCYARLLVDEFGEQRGRDLIKRAIWDYGTKIGEQAIKRVKDMGLEPTIENIGKGSDLSPIGVDFSSAVVDGEVRSHVRNCPWASVWLEYGEADLGGLYCLVDPAKTQAYDPGWTQVHTQKVTDKAPFCELVYRPLKKEK